MSVCRCVCVYVHLKVCGCVDVCVHLNVCVWMFACVCVCMSHWSASHLGKQPQLVELERLARTRVHHTQSYRQK